MNDTNTPAEADILLKAGAALCEKKVIEVDDGDFRDFVVVPEGYNLQTMEHLYPAPWRKRGLVTLHDAKSFGRYLNEQGGAISIFGVRSKGAFVAILDSNTMAGPGWQEHRAAFTASYTPEWNRWLNGNGKRMSQVDFASFIEDNLPDVTDPVGAEMLEMCRLLEAKKKVEFISGVRLSNGENELSYEETISGTAGKGKFPVPETFTIAIPPFEGSDRFKMSARLRYRIGDDKKLVMWFDLDRPHKIVEAAVADIWTEIESITSIQIFNGLPA